MLWFKQKSDQVHITLVCFKRVARDGLLCMDVGLIAFLFFCRCVRNAAKSADSGNERGKLSSEMLIQLHL